MSFTHPHNQSNSVSSSGAKGKLRLSYFLARRIYRDTDGGKQVSRPAVVIAMIGIAIGLAVMIIAVSVVIGFKSEVRNKVIGFGSHIQISNFDAVGSYETHPVVVNDSMMVALSALPEVKHVQRYSTKPGMIKTDDAFQGMVLKGVGPEFDPTFFRDHLIEGEIPAFSDTASTNQVVISKAIADRLKLKLGDKIYTYFIQKDVRARRLTVKGIYQTNFSEYDNLFLLTDLYLVNRLNNWAPGQVSGAELQVRDYDKLEDITYRIATDTDNKQDIYGGTYYVQSIEQMNPQIFAWLDLLDLNVWVILILMVVMNLLQARSEKRVQHGAQDGGCVGPAAAVFQHNGCSDLRVVRRGVADQHRVDIMAAAGQRVRQLRAAGLGRADNGGLAQHAGGLRHPFHAVPDGPEHALAAGDFGKGRCVLPHGLAGGGVNGAVGKMQGGLAAKACQRSRVLCQLQRRYGGIALADRRHQGQTVLVVGIA